MRCPFCGNIDTQVKDSRPAEDHVSIRRRRFCPACGGRFTTYERVQLRDLVVIKKSGRREAFDRDKLERSIRIAMQKRPIETERLDQMISGIVRRLEVDGRDRHPLGHHRRHRHGDAGAHRHRRLRALRLASTRTSRRRTTSRTSSRSCARRRPAGTTTEPMPRRRGRTRASCARRSGSRGAASAGSGPIPRSAACWCATAASSAAAGPATAAGRMPRRVALDAGRRAAPAAPRPT